MNRLRRKEQRIGKLSRGSDNKGRVYCCSGCRLPLFEEAKKFDSKTGFPSFWLHLGENVKENFLTTYGRERTQLLCRKCGQHPGHLFPHKNTPTLVRYCIRHESICHEHNETYIRNSSAEEIN